MTPAKKNDDAQKNTNQADKGVKSAAGNAQSPQKREKAPEALKKPGPRRKPQRAASAKKPPKPRAYTAKISLLTPKQKNDPALREFYAKIERFIKNNLFLDDGAKVVLAVSGGVDSIVMLDVMAVLSEKCGWRLAAAHYNHDLRGEASYEDEKFVRAAAKKYDITAHCSKGRVKQYAEKNSLSIEHAARILRYMFFERTARIVGAGVVATAHSSDDSAETFLINLIRGSGLTGLSGVPQKRRIGRNITLIRPLLQMKKAALIDYAKKRNLEWREDETNALKNYTRNKVRLDLIPKLKKDFNPSIVDALIRSARLLQGADEFIGEFVKIAVTDLLCDKSSDSFSIKIPLLQTFSEFMQGEIIHEACLKHLQIQSMSLQTVDRIIALQDSETGSFCDISKHEFVLKDRLKLIFHRKKTDFECDMSIERTGDYETGLYRLFLSEVKMEDVKYDGAPKIEFFDMETIPTSLTLRNWRPGDSFQPLGMKGTMKISDFLTNEKASIIDKRKTLVLATKTDIVSVCGMRISDKFKITKSTNRILRCDFSEKKDRKVKTT